ncbi:MAG: 1-acyl-sn-glycerol-3-phosphate acyltransferase [Acidobacteria bacterium]|nr:1-acyl-sn-glycerol-3-phosphate acyltransferase [Acidobacteriota bacterium]
MALVVIRMARRAWRVSRLAAHLLLAVPRAVRLFRQTRRGTLAAEEYERTVRWFCGGVLEALHVPLSIRGEPLRGGHVSAANHVSFLDVPALGAASPGRFVAKAEIAGWPLLGWLGRSARTIYLARQRSRAGLSAVETIEQALQDGDHLILFPEGTTTDGCTLLPFHAVLLDGAVRAGAWLQPVLLRYPDARDPSRCNLDAAWIGTETAFALLWRVAAARETPVEITYLEPFRADGHRRDVAERLRAAIVAALADATRAGQ